MCCPLPDGTERRGTTYERGTTMYSAKPPASSAKPITFAPTGSSGDSPEPTATTSPAMSKPSTTGMGSWKTLTRCMAGSM